MKNLWNQNQAKKAKDKLDLLVYSSRLIGSEPKLCVWGGGNTSTKTIEKDHLSRKVKVLRIKGSGSDLKVSTRNDYPPVNLEELREAFKFKKMTDDEMVGFVSKCLLEPKAPRPSIEVLLHAFVDHPDIHHTHADAILSITNTKNGKALAKKIYGDELLWVPYIKPGFTLAKWVGEAFLKAPEAKGIILEKHGLITWGKDAKTSYARTIQMVTRAEQYLAKKKKQKKYWSKSAIKSLSKSESRAWLDQFLPVIRKGVSAKNSVILRFWNSPEVMGFVNAKDTPVVSQKGPATPDHMLRTRRVPLCVKIPAGNPEKLSEADLLSQIENYAKLHDRYFERNKKSLPVKDRKTKLDPFPKVILIPGVGMVTTGKDIKSANIVGEIYEHSISVMKAASIMDTYDSLSERLAFEMDYWPMELFKLSLAPAEAELSRQVGLVTGAARGIGLACALKLAKDGAIVFLADLDKKSLEKRAKQINDEVGALRAFALPMDVTSPSSVHLGFQKIVRECGGLDFVVSNAGIAHVSAIESLKLKDWEKSFAVNATGHFLVSREAINLLKKQNLGGAIVFIASKNVLAPGKDFGAYSASKAAQSQLARILAIENGGQNIRVNMVNPDGVFEDSGLWDSISANRAKTYGIKKEKLANFYQDRNLMKTAILPSDVAESVSFLISEKASKTTGCILTVDGGVKEAFPR